MSRNKPKVSQAQNILVTLYSCGLRVSEVLALSPPRYTIRLQTGFGTRGKGKKDRTTVLAPTTLELLGKYYLVYRPEA
jgi:integrase/recombinase XerD